MPQTRIDATVIILGHNGLSYIDGCLGSVLNQDFPVDRYEVIWADNASTDDSAEYIRRQFPQVRVVQFASNYGFAEGNNRATKEANGQYLVFLNQDTVVHKSWLRTLIGAMDANPDLGACQVNMVMPWHKEFHSLDQVSYPDTVHFAEIGRYGFVEYRECPMQQNLIPTTFLTGASFIVSRPVLERMPYVFDPLFGAYSEDLDFSLRLKALGYHAAVAPRAVVYHLQQSYTVDFRFAVRKAYWGTRNRFLAYYKTLPWHRFLVLLPKLFLGALLKVKQFHFGQAREILMMVTMLPIATVALLEAIWLMARYLRYDQSHKHYVAEIDFS